MSGTAFWSALAAALAAGLLIAGLVTNEYYLFAAYVVLQGMVMAIAWNILGGFTGYVNFGTAGFFAAGAYATIALNKLLGGLGFHAPLVVFIAIGAVVGGLIGLGCGYLTLRLRGVYFAIATLALAIVLQTFINNWDYVGGAKGSYMLISDPPFPFRSYISYMFTVMLMLALIAIAISRYITVSRFGRGLAAIRDDELAAECMGVPTLRLKLVSATLMGGLMGMAGAPYPFYVTFVDPASAFSLIVAVNSIAMPMIGGTAYWYGPVIGALLLGITQEVVSVTISSEWNVFIVGVALVLFVTLAPRGIVGLVQRLRGKANGNG
jgi:branched-chain amino acid transport system permease protein